MSTIGDLANRISVDATNLNATVSAEAKEYAQGLAILSQIDFSVPALAGLLDQSAVECELRTSPNGVPFSRIELVSIDDNIVVRLSGEGGRYHDLCTAHDFEFLCANNVPEALDWLNQSFTKLSDAIQARDAFVNPR